MSKYSQLMSKYSQRAGFTLVELAIVLVIIGLLVGGVLVGQDLIKAAEIRASIKQMEDTNSAVNTFRTKYGGFPGDLNAARAISFQFIQRNGTTSGNGNGLIEGAGASAADNSVFGGENALVWSDLSLASLIPSNYPGLGTAAVPATGNNGGVAVTAATRKDFLPQMRIREGASIHVTVSQGRNNYALATFTSTATAITTRAALTPLEAKSIDEKTDDGYPLTGSTVAIGGADGTANNGVVATITSGAQAGWGVAIATTPATNPCLQASQTVGGVVVPDDYRVTTAGQTAVACQLVVRASF